MKLHRLVLPGLVLLANLVAAPRADAQLLWRLFGPKTTEKTPPAKANPSDPKRATEVNVEVAWLADPVTFPYYLEAKIAGSKLEVRGYVPSKAVREHALRIAQVYSSLPVTDSMKEHPSLMVKSNLVSAQQLQNSAVSSLKVALPKQYNQFKVECAADGKVFVLGTVTSVEEKMAVSNSLRRLHGCTSVQNLTTLTSDMAQNMPRDKTPIVKTSNPSDKPTVAQDNKSKPWLQFPWNKNTQTTREEPPLLDPRKGPSKEPAVVDMKKPTPKDGPILITNGPDAKNPPVVKVDVPPPAPGPKTTLSAAELRRRIQAACPQAKNVDVQYAVNQEVRITLEIRSENEITAAAERVFAMPEMENLRPELQFKVSAP